MEKYAQEFQDLHQIPYMVGAINGSHIPIVASQLHAPDYYNRKGFHSILLQGVVSAKCLFWDFDIGWAGSMHDANFWGRTTIGQYCEAGKLHPYALVGDAAYPCRPLDVSSFQRPQKWSFTRGIPLELCPKFHPHVRRACFWDAKRQVVNSFEEGERAFEERAWLGFHIFGFA